MAIGVSLCLIEHNGYCSSISVDTEGRFVRTGSREAMHNASG